VKTWTDVYRHLKDKKNPLKLSSSEHRNLTKKMTEYIFEQGQANSGDGVNHGPAIDVIRGLQMGLSQKGERFRALQGAIEALREDEKANEEPKAA
jgi:hypothetical protein